PYGRGAHRVKPRRDARDGGGRWGLEPHPETGRERGGRDPVPPTQGLTGEEPADSPAQEEREACAEGEKVPVGVIRGHREERVGDVVDVPRLDVAAIVLELVTPLGRDLWHEHPDSGADGIRDAAAQRCLNG